MLRSIITPILFAAMSVQTLASPVTVESCNRQVTFDKVPTRAASNDVNLTEMMLVLGLEDHMVGYTGISGWNKLDAKMRESVAELPELSPRYPTKEVLIGADLDFWFAGWNYGMRVGGEVTPETLAAFDIAVYELTESCVHIMPRKNISMADMYNDIRNLGIIFKVEDRAEKLIADWKTQLIDITTSISGSSTPQVFIYDSGEDSPFTAGKYAMPTAMIEAAGGKNIMDDIDSSWTKVAWEPVIDRNPEVIVIVNYGKVTAEQKIAFLKQQPALSSMDAVINNRFVVLEYVEATPGPRNIDAIKKLAKAFHNK
ncbi:ABC transporter substrate-binding protein [Candidatus Njordibacter sp. Uisw_056]|jgi:iron complex transport system substrate-binding protein|uniref:ABC transporter substrate-binding protein n=1 Tax=Candidatus Njordibacter sp. Uisw_056 TaxID=3230973 RepID=UPI003D46C1C2